MQLSRAFEAKWKSLTWPWASPYMQQIGAKSGSKYLSGLKMKLRSTIRMAFGKLSEIKEGRLHLVLLAFFCIPIILIWFLDFFNIEIFAPFNQEFMFDLTWKGRMFYLSFVWLLLLESVLDWNTIIKRLRVFRNRFRIILFCIVAAVPTVYIVCVNFLGLNQMILNIGQTLQIRSEFIDGAWPLSVEYLTLALSFIFATWLAYGSGGLKSFSISLSLLTGIGLVFLVDTIWPYGTLKPMQLVALPTAACAIALLDLLGYSARLAYPVSSPQYGTVPQMTVLQGAQTVRAEVGWSCAGVQSLLLFTLIILVFFKKTTIPRDRKINYFLIGAAGTYLTNILRLTSFFIISLDYGSEVGNVFHNVYGELYFIVWMFLFLMMIIVIQSGIIGRFVRAFRQGLRTFLKRKESQESS